MDKRAEQKIKRNRLFWQQRAKKYGTSYQLSWGDHNMIDLEVKNIRPYVHRGARALDAGCANGFSTLAIAHGKKLQLDAFDTCVPAIQYAQNQQRRSSPKNAIHFFTGDILNIERPSNTYDVAWTIRVLINLPNWRLQQQGIHEIHRVLKPSGLYLLSEAFAGSLKKLNELRRLASLPPLLEPSFNCYLKEKQFEQYIKKLFTIVEIKKFSSIYYVGSRFMRYLTMKPTDQDSFNNPLNNFFAQFEETPQSGDFGIQKLYILKKKR